MKPSEVQAEIDRILRDLKTAQKVFDESDLGDKHSSYEFAIRLDTISERLDRIPKFSRLRIECIEATTHLNELIENYTERTPGDQSAPYPV